MSHVCCIVPTRASYVTPHERCHAVLNHVKIGSAAAAAAAAASVPAARGSLGACDMDIAHAGAQPRRRGVCSRAGPQHAVRDLVPGPYALRMRA